MSDLIDEFLSAGAPVAREVRARGKVKTYHFRLIDAAQREQLVKGQRITSRAGEKASVELDLGQNERTKRLLVQFSVCSDAGVPLFGNEAAVAALPALVLDALYEQASAVNEDRDPGNS